VEAAATSSLGPTKVIAVARSIVRRVAMKLDHHPCKPSAGSRQLHRARGVSRLRAPSNLARLAIQSYIAPAMKLDRRSTNFIAPARSLDRAVDLTSSRQSDEVCAATIQLWILADAA
jgi:hypothetical protein